MMAQILSPEAQSRLGAIAAVKPDRAEALENIIIQNAQRGTFQGKVSESQMVDLLEQMSAVDAKEETKVERKRHAFDSDEDLDLDNLDL